MGLTSLLSLELRNRLERALGRALPATLAWNYPTIAALSKHLAGEAGGHLPRQAGTTDRTGRGGRTARGGFVISDADALSALRQRRRRA